MRDERRIEPIVNDFLEIPRLAVWANGFISLRKKH